MNVLRLDAFFYELLAVAFPKVDVPFFFHHQIVPLGERRVVLWVRAHGWIALGEFFHGEVSLGKKVIHFVAHLEAFGADAWPDDGMQVFGACAIGGYEHVDVGFDDAF